MVQAVSRQFLISDFSFRYQVSPYGICGGLKDPGPGFLLVFWFSPVSIAPMLKTA